jgi:hypothetical protein
MTRFASLPLSLPAVVLAAAASAAADPPVKLAERFDEANTYRVGLTVSVSGKLTVPVAADKPPQVVALSGRSNLVYDERPLPGDDPTVKKLVRAYRTVQFDRTIGDQEQKAGVREAVRRMVVLRADAGTKAPFSPDGPLTFGEIDVVKNDLFAPTLVPGLLPAKEVKPGDTWRAAAAAVQDLTDLDRIEEGGLTVEFVGVVTVNGRRHAKLTVGGTVKGVNEDGPNRQRLDGTAYFDLEADRLDYLKLAGTHEMLGANGKVTGTIEGTFLMTREARRADDLADAALKGLDLKPTDDNSLLLHDDPELGVRLLYPRRWRVGVVQGRQFTLDEPKGGGVLVTVTPPAKTPTAAAFQDEVKQFLAKQKAKVSPLPEPKRVTDKPALDRFGLDAELDSGKARLEYAVLTTPDGGATVAARLPEKLAAELQPDLDRILKQLTITKRIADK